MQGHSASDDASYVPPALLEQWKAKDPIARYQKSLLDRKVLTAEQVANEETKIHLAVEEAVHEALQRPYPQAAEASQGVYAVPGGDGWRR
jgi:TPP-dependent pyruvate/acetoin dehydrogenase alpha subunit